MVNLDQGGRNAHSLIAAYPERAAAAYVESIAVVSSMKGGQSERAWRVVANVAPHVVLSFEGGTHRLMLVGARQTHVDIDSSRRSLTIVARLRPGAIRPLMRIRADEITDCACSLDEVTSTKLGPAMAQLVNEAHDAPLNAMATFLERIALRALPMDPRLGLLASLTHDPRVSVSRIAVALGLSERALRELAWRDVGVSPKQMMRIQRLHRALRAILVRREASLSRAAADAGYSDQAHFTRECTSLLGESPGSYVRRGMQ